MAYGKLQFFVNLILSLGVYECETGQKRKSKNFGKKEKISLQFSFGERILVLSR